LLPGLTGAQEAVLPHQTLGDVPVYESVDGISQFVEYPINTAMDDLLLHGAI